VQVVRKTCQLLEDRLVAAKQPVIAHHRGNRDRETKCCHDQRLADRAGDRVDRRLPRHADADQRAIDADDGTEQADERSGRPNRRKQRQARAQPRGDRPLAACQRVQHPLMLLDRIGQLAMLLLGEAGVVDELAVGAVLFELVGAFPQAVGLPKGGTGTAALVENFLLFEQLGEHDVPGSRGHYRENKENGNGHGAALLESGNKAIWVRAARCGCCGC
jgi:hypothetical protein